MRITVVPASPRTGKAAIRALLADPSSPVVTGVYRDLAKVPAEFSSHGNFRAVRGDIGDGASLDFAGADSVLTITPPLFEDGDIVAFARAVSGHVKAAAQKAGVRRLVLVSSVGAQFASGTGEIGSNHAAEVVLADAAPEVVFVRCAYFMENWEAALATIQEASFFDSAITPLDFAMPMVAVDDIGAACAAQALSTAALPSQPFAVELHGPRDYTVEDVRRGLEKAAGKPIEARPVPKSALRAYFAQIFPPGRVDGWVEMSESTIPGGIIAEDYKKTKPVQRGALELEEVLGRLYKA